MKLIILLMFVVPDEFHHFLVTHDVPEAIRSDDYEPLNFGVERVYLYIWYGGYYKLSTTRAERPKVT